MSPLGSLCPLAGFVVQRLNSRSARDVSRTVSRREDVTRAEQQCWLDRIRGVGTEATAAAAAPGTSPWAWYLKDYLLL